MKTATLPHLPDDLLSLLMNQDGKLVTRIWPEDQANGGLETALQEAGRRTRFDSLIRHVRLLNSELPVIAVAGLLNSGKSSVVASFLSVSGRTRVLRGLNKEDVTQRFVLWCPLAWKQDEERRSALAEVLGEIFSGGLELLSEEGDKAHIQYNGLSEGAEFETPLVGYDEGLNAMGFALLDCPDVERPHPGASGTNTRRMRLAVLKRASSIASALLVVADHGKTAMEEFANTVTEVLNEMPGIPAWLLVNCCSCETEYPPDKIVNDVQADSTLRGVYLAYNYLHDAERWRECTPSPLHDLRTERAVERLPAFYLAEPDPARNPPAPVDEARFLRHLPEQMQSQGGVGAPLRALHSKRLVVEAAETEQELRLHVEQAFKRTRKQWESLLQVCFKGLLDGKGQLVVPLTGDTAERIQSALIKSAPLMDRLKLKSALVLGRVAGWVKSRVSDLKNWVVGLFSKELNKSVKNMIARVDTQRFVDEMVRESFALDVLPDNQKRLHVWQTVLTAHHRHAPDQLEEAELVDALTEVWQKRRLTEKVFELAAPLALVALLLAFAFAHVDGGATLGLVAAKIGLPTMAFVGPAMATSIVGYLSVSELLIALGVAAAVMPVAGWKIESLMRDRLALPALSNLFACACDAFGLPRRIGKEPTVTIRGRDLKLPNPSTERGLPVIRILDEAVWEMHDESWKELQKMLKTNAAHTAKAAANQLRQ